MSLAGRGYLTPLLADPGRDWSPRAGLSSAGGPPNPSQGPILPCSSPSGRAGNTPPPPRSGQALLLSVPTPSHATCHSLAFALCIVQTPRRTVTSLKPHKTFPSQSRGPGTGARRMLVPPANNLWLVGRGEAELAAAPPSPNPPNKIQLEKEKSDFCVCLCNSNRKRPARPGRGGEGTVGGGVSSKRP